MEYLFSPIFEGDFDATSYLICSLTSLILGCIVAFTHYKLHKANSSMTITIILLPFVVQTVLMFVNGDVGTGVAIAGAFSLIRFRSVQCTPEEIIIIFAGMAIGLATSTGYVFVAIIFTVALVICLYLYELLIHQRTFSQHKQLRITIPESLNYDQAFEKVFNGFTTSHQLMTIKTTNMGSLYKLTYNIELIDPQNTQAFINELRVLNGNLEISITDLPENNYLEQ